MRLLRNMELPLCNKVDMYLLRKSVPVAMAMELLHPNAAAEWD